MQTISIVGLGYVGLPLAVQAASKGYVVHGIDSNKETVKSVNLRKSPFTNDTRFAKALTAARKDLLTASTSYANCAISDVVIICVPTPTINNVPDLSYVLSATKEVSSHIRIGQLVILESTVNPGVTRHEVMQLLQKGSGLTAGKDFNLAHCPERIDPGNETLYVGNINRVVGGITEACTHKAATFYDSIIDASIVPLASTEEAEFVKSWENTHRNAMVALANSAAVICDALGMDIDNVIMGMQSKVGQFGLNLAKPGIGPGGHCIPEDIHFVVKKAKEHGVDTTFLEESARLNDSMPQYAVDKLETAVESGNEHLSELRIGLLGLAYKPNVSDFRRSPAIEVGKMLATKAKELLVHDTYMQAPDLIPGSRKATTVTEMLTNVDAIVIGTGHDEYITAITADTLQQAGIRYVLDGRNVLNKHQIEKAGICYVGIGK